MKLHISHPLCRVFSRVHDSTKAIKIHKNTTVVVRNKVARFSCGQGVYNHCESLSLKVLAQRNFAAQFSTKVRHNSQNGKLAFENKNQLGVLCRTITNYNMVHIQGASKIPPGIFLQISHKWFKNYNFYIKSYPFILRFYLRLCAK